MDPAAAIENLIHCIRSFQPDEARTVLAELLEWSDQDGFIPEVQVIRAK